MNFKHSFDQKNTKNSNNVKSFHNLKIAVFYCNILLNIIDSYDAKLNFQHHCSSLQCHMILQLSFWYDYLLLNKHFLLLSILKTVVMLNIFVETLMIFFCDEKVHMNRIYLKYNIFLHIYYKLGETIKHMLESWLQKLYCMLAVTTKTKYSCTFTFTQLADAFIQSGLQMRTMEAHIL